jgi:hypothetical protein
MNSNPNVKLIPVIRRPRRQWQIPTSDQYAPSAQEIENEARAKAFAEGTTAYGREIFRRVLDLAWRLCEGNPRSSEVISQIDAEIRIFPELQAEFLLMASRLGENPAEEQARPDGSPAEDYGQVSTFGLAAILVMRARFGQKFNREQAAVAEVESA